MAVNIIDRSWEDMAIPPEQSRYRLRQFLIPVEIFERIIVGYDSARSRSEWWHFEGLEECQGTPPQIRCLEWSAAHAGFLLLLWHPNFPVRQNHNDEEWVVILQAITHDANSPEVQAIIHDPNPPTLRRLRLRASTVLQSEDPNTPPF